MSVLCLECENHPLNCTCGPQRADGPDRTSDTITRWDTPSPEDAEYRTALCRFLDDEQDSPYVSLEEFGLPADPHEALQELTVLFSEYTDYLDTSDSTVQAV